MSKEKRQFAKKKEREKKAKEKVLARREMIQQKTKELRMWEKEEYKNRPRHEPIKNMSEQMKQYLHNLEILRILNEEHEKGNI